MVIPTEHDEQVTVVQWLMRQHKDILFFAIPNGGLRSKRTAINLKAEGVRKGVPDMMIPALFLFVEMKRQKGGTVSPEQKSWLEYLKSCGYRCEVCRGADDAIEVISRYVNEAPLSLTHEL